MYRLKQYSNWEHPQRETQDYSAIFDAEYMNDLSKLLEEQRHEVAIECVKLGIYKDVVEAKSMQRKVRMEQSDYKFKHLLFRK